MGIKSHPNQQTFASLKRSWEELHYCEVSCSKFICFKGFMMIQRLDTMGANGIIGITFITSGGFLFWNIFKIFPFVTWNKSLDFFWKLMIQFTVKF